MFTEKSLNVFRGIKKEELYHPGSWVEEKHEEIPEETKGVTPLYDGIWAESWPSLTARKAEEKPFAGSELERFHIPSSLRNPKEKQTLTKMSMISTTDDIPQYPRDIAEQITPQLPIAFPDLAGLGDTAETLSDLINNVSALALGVEQAKAKADVIEAQTKLAEAGKPVIATLPFLLLAGLGIFLVTKKKR